MYCRTLESVPAEPANIKAVGISSDSVLAAWQPPASLNGRILLYKIYMKTMVEGQPFTQISEVNIAFISHGSNNGNSCMYSTNVKDMVAYFIYITVKFKLKKRHLVKRGH